MTHASDALREMQRTQGACRLSLAAMEGRTRVKEMYQEGAAKVRLLSPPRSAAVEAVLINTAGGLTGGDRLDWQVRLGPQAVASVTTQACEKIYRSSGGEACVTTSIHLEKQAKLAWVPQETILYDKARLKRSIVLHMAPDAEAMFCESLVFGRQRMGEAMTEGSISDRWQIFRDQQLIHVEALRLEGEISRRIAGKATTSGAIAMATLLLIGERFESSLPAIQQHIQPHGAAAFWDGKLLARILAEDSYSLRKILCPLIADHNPAGGLPKVWNI